MKTNRTVIVLFDVNVEANLDAEKLVEERLEKARLLWENYASDAANGTLDPINTWVVVPARELLDDSI